MIEDGEHHRMITRRTLLGGAGVGGLALLARRASAQTTVELPFAPQARQITSEFPQKGPMILQRTRPPLLETPWDVFDKGVFTPADQFYVRWHWALIPTDVSVDSFRLNVRGHVNQPLSLSLNDILHGLPRVELAAVNQCSGNSRGFFAPRVAGAQWANGAMGNALWTRRSPARRAGPCRGEGRRGSSAVQRPGAAGDAGCALFPEVAHYRSCP
jgi:DMSO/TMAO reductase YedYZ molybdopterin-dependent catalytic subunit